MVPDYLHTPNEERYAREKVFKEEERVLDVEGKELLTFKNADAETGKPVCIVVSGFIKRRNYEIRNNIPVSEVETIAEDEKEKIREAVRKEYKLKVSVSFW